MTTVDIDDLLAQMTLDEKLAQLGGAWITALVGDGGFDPAAARNVIGHGIGHVTRIGAATGLFPAETAPPTSAPSRRRGTTACSPPPSTSSATGCPRAA